MVALHQVSGCSDTEEAEMILRHETTREATNHGLYFSPSFAIEHPVVSTPYFRPVVIHVTLGMSTFEVPSWMDYVYDLFSRVKLKPCLD